MKIFFSLLSVLWFFSSAALAQTLPEPPTLSGSELTGLLTKMKAGGHVIFFRHLDTRQDQEDRQPIELNDCKAQRNLSDEGRARGALISRVFKKMKIPVGAVTSSPFCRTVETAKIIFGKTSTDADLFFAIALSDAAKKQKGEALRKMMAKPPAKGTNSIIVSHTANLQEAIGLWPKPEGVAYVLHADSNGNLEAVARIAPDSWASLAK